MRNTWKKRRFLALLLALLLTAGLLAGCGGASQGEGETKTVTDCMGRKVEIPQQPQRVACLYAAAAHMMAMLDEQDRIAGCPNGVKSDVLMQMKAPDIGKTATPHQEGSINAEEMLRIDADLAMVGYSLANSGGELEKLDKMGIPYVVVDYTSIEELREAIRVAGAVFDKEEQAADYLAFFDETLDMVDRKLKNVKKKERPFVYHSVNEATRTDPQGTICSEIMERAKVIDLSVHKGLTGTDKNAYVTLEELYKWNPQAIIANEYSVTDYILTDSKWEGLQAVKEKKVYTLPVGATRWCHPGSMEAHMGVLAVAQQFYPEKFKDLDMEAYTADYYKKYFNLELDKKTVRKILSGKGMRASNSPE